MLSQKKVWKLWCRKYRYCDFQSIILHIRSNYSWIQYDDIARIFFTSRLHRAVLWWTLGWKHIDKTLPVHYFHRKSNQSLKYFINIVCLFMFTLSMWFLDENFVRNAPSYNFDWCIIFVENSIKVPSSIATQYGNSYIWILQKLRLCCGNTIQISGPKGSHNVISCQTLTWKWSLTEFQLMHNIQV